MSSFSASSFYTKPESDPDPVVKRTIDDLFATLVDHHLTKPEWDNFGLFTVADAITAARYDRHRSPSAEAVLLARKIMTHYKNSLAKMIMTQDKGAIPVTDWHISVYKLLNATNLSEVIGKSNEPQNVEAVEVYSSVKSEAATTDPISRELSLLATLPLFYEEEMQLKTLVEQYPDQLVEHDKNGNTLLFNNIEFTTVTKKPLTLVVELQHRSKAKRYSNFVFTDGKDLFYINIKYAEARYYTLFKSCIRDNKIVVTGHLVSSILDQKLKAYELSGWEINHDEY